MRKILFTAALLLSSGIIFGQSFDWNLRGGLNFMKSMNEGKDLAVLYHAGGQAGIRITSFGIYAEAIYSLNENQNGGDPVAYFQPSLLLKGFLTRFLFVEVGGTLLHRVGNVDLSGVLADMNPSDDTYMFAGLGVKVSKIQLSVRSTVKNSYGLFNLTAAFRF